MGKLNNVASGAVIGQGPDEQQFCMVIMNIIEGGAGGEGVLLSSQSTHVARPFPGIVSKCPLELQTVGEALI